MIDANELVLNIIDDNGVIDEGFGKNLIQFGVLSSLLASAGIVNASQFNRNVNDYASSKGNSSKVITMTKSELNDIIMDSLDDERTNVMVGDWELNNAINVVARTLYMEARGEGVKGLKMVMSVIWNRAEGDINKLADKCLERKQFSCWNKITNKSPSTYEIQFPKSATMGKGSDFDMWKICQRLATNAFEGKFTPDDPTWNAYYNPNAVKKIPSWDKDLKNAKMVGHHKVGNLKWYKTTSQKQTIASTPSTPSTYVVQKNDNLTKIAKANHTTIAKLKELNGLKSDFLRIGQKLKIA